MGGLMPRPRIRKNGVPGESEITWSAMEVAVASVLLTGVIGFGAWISAVQIVTARSLAEVGGDVRALRNELAARVEMADKQHAMYQKRLDDMEQWRYSQSISGWRPKR